MSDLVTRARDYLKQNAAESGADVLIRELANEIERLRAGIEDLEKTAEWERDFAAELLNPTD